MSDGDNWHVPSPQCVVECPHCKKRSEVNANWWQQRHQLDQAECFHCHKMVSLHQYKLRRAPWVRLVA